MRSDVKQALAPSEEAVRQEYPSPSGLRWMPLTGRSK